MLVHFLCETFELRVSWFLIRTMQSARQISAIEYCKLCTLYQRSPQGLAPSRVCCTGLALQRANLMKKERKREKNYFCHSLGILLWYPAHSWSLQVMGKSRFAPFHSLLCSCLSGCSGVCPRLHVFPRSIHSHLALYSADLRIYGPLMLILEQPQKIPIKVCWRLLCVSWFSCQYQILLWSSDAKSIQVQILCTPSLSIKLDLLTTFYSSIPLSSLIAVLFVWNTSCNVQTGCRVNRATRLCQAESYDYSLNLVINCLDMWHGNIFESCLVSTTEPHEIAQTFLAFKSQAESVRGGNWDHACEKLESMGFINLVSQVSTLKDCVIFSDPGNLNSESDLWKSLGKILVTTLDLLSDIVIYFQS